MVTEATRLDTMTFETLRELCNTTLALVESTLDTTLGCRKLRKQSPLLS
jgi:hypothetical protein